MTQAQTTVGVISDTHGVVRPEAIEALRGSEWIIHAGDVGDPDVLERLRAIAPTVAVRGNVDNGPWAQTLPVSEVVRVGDVLLYVLHRLEDLDLDPKTAGFAAVIYGHSHQPSSETRDGILFLNPGSAGPRRFRLPVAIAKIRVVGDEPFTGVHSSSRVGEEKCHVRSLSVRRFGARGRTHGGRCGTA